MGLFSSIKTEHLTSERLSELIDNGLSGNSFINAEVHLVACSFCSSQLDQLRETVLVLQSLPSVKPPKQFTLPKTSKHAAHKITFAAPAKVLAYVAVLFLVVVGGGIFTASQTPQGAMPVMQSFMASSELVVSDINIEKVIQLNPADAPVMASDSVQAENRFNGLIYFVSFSVITGIIFILYLRTVRRNRS